MSDRAANSVLLRGLDARRAHLMQRLELMVVNDVPDDGYEVALEALCDEFEFLAELQRELVWQLQLDAIALRWL